MSLLSVITLAFVRISMAVAKYKKVEVHFLMGPHQQKRSPAQRRRNYKTSPRQTPIFLSAAISNIRKLNCIVGKMVVTIRITAKFTRYCWIAQGSCSHYGINESSCKNQCFLYPLFVEKSTSLTVEGPVPSASIAGNSNQNHKFYLSHSDMYSAAFLWQWRSGSDGNLCPHWHGVEPHGQRL